MKRWICLLLALALPAACACAEGAAFTLRFDEGFSLRLPAGWVSYPAEGAGVRYALGDGTGGRYLYILAQDAPFEDFDALQAAVAEGGREPTGALDMKGQPFAAFIAPDLNASGCATLLGGELITFLFTPQSDSEYMLAAAQIMDSFALDEGAPARSAQP